MIPTTKLKWGTLFVIPAMLFLIGIGNVKLLSPNPILIGVCFGILSLISFGICITSFTGFEQGLGKYLSKMQPMIHRLVFMLTVVPMFFISLVWWVITGKYFFGDYVNYFDNKFKEQR